jgi:hypothetical protein
MKVFFSQLFVAFWRRTASKNDAKMGTEIKEKNNSCLRGFLVAFEGQNGCLKSPGHPRTSPGRSPDGPPDAALRPKGPKWARGALWRFQKGSENCPVWVQKSTFLANNSNFFHFNTQRFWPKKLTL